MLQLFFLMQHRRQCALCDQQRELPDIDEESADDFYLQSIHDADSALKSEVDENPALAGMGTTLT